MPSFQSSTVKQIAMDDDDTPFLPQDIISSILARLPVKSLIRFQCVCKQWNVLFKIPSFIQDHIHHSSHQNPCLLIQRDWGLASLDSGKQLHEFQNAPYYSLERIIGSSNGLICLEIVNDDRYSYSLLLWNPATREFKQVPATINDFERSYDLRFGFISMVNDYKIVRIYLSFNDEVYGVDQAELYSLSTGSWKEVDVGNLKGEYVCRRTINANGAMFWLRYDRDGFDQASDHKCIVSFDIANEVFTLIPMPTVEPYSITNVTVYENKLAMLSSNKTGEDEYCIQLWVMEEGTSASGERWNWTKNWATNYTSTRLVDLYPLTIWMNTIVCLPEFLGRSEIKENTLYLFDITSDEVKRGIAISRYWFDVFNYVESVISFGNIQVERKKKLATSRSKKMKKLIFSIKWKAFYQLVSSSQKKKKIGNVPVKEKEQKVGNVHIEES